MKLKSLVTTILFAVGGALAALGLIVLVVDVTTSQTLPSPELEQSSKPKVGSLPPIELRCFLLDAPTPKDKLFLCFSGTIGALEQSKPAIPSGLANTDSSGASVLTD